MQLSFGLMLLLTSLWLLGGAWILTKI